MANHLRKLTIALNIAALSLAGCSAAKPAEPAPAAADQPKSAEKSDFVVSTEPITLKLYANVVRLSDIEYKNFFIDPIKKKYPNITIEKVDGDLEKLVMSGNVPDLIVSDSDWHMPLQALDLPLDLTDLVARSKMDLSKFVPETIQAVRNLDAKGKELQGIPYNLNPGALFYNKDIFDKFGVPYPKDDMLWSDVLELSRKLTRAQDGVQYIGWDPRFPDHLVSPYTQPFVDPKTGKALVDIPLYHKVLELFKANYDQPGVVVGKTYAYGPDQFIKDKKLAMQADWVAKLQSDLLQADANGVGINWDVVTNPTFEDAKGKGRHTLTSMLVITKASKYKEQAMQVIQLITSPEQQMAMSKDSQVTVLNDPEIVKAYGTGNPALKGKNTAAYFKYKSSPTPTPNKYDKEVQTLIRNMRGEMALNKKDINTVLRETQEAADKKIAELSK
ncbi:ABC transporter substrate-binding protein [Paenibacillus cremeus]|uniref:Carbohydrate ABC transporter substrate-binding protein n=1 Tax=Paenibacillus cremeus TaxID=2163881 RepID=A0A559K9U9_9BACL|nr:ABC transporter substrate-binding protein [Paenibacillus cremeus]TVY08892.1 carbohydrate ABC transporter substrate-binding protein [Paenibacillus cremeus]